MLQFLEQYTLLVQYTLIFASVLMLVALGGCFSEHSGVINLGLEGIMVIGALGGALMMFFLQDKVSGFPMVVLTLLAAILSGVAYSALLGVACINFKADQTIIGTALNLLGAAAATVIVKAVNSKQFGKPDDSLAYRVGRSSFTSSFTIGNTNFEFNWFMVIAVVMLIIAIIVLYKTKFGLRLMACGEHPQAAASVGVSVFKMRWAGVLISGAYGGLGGICYIMAGGGTWHFSYGVAGFGFLSLAVMIFGQWKPYRIALAALLFGFFRALSNVNGSISLLSQLNLPPTVYNMLPYIVSLIVLAFTSKKSRAPKAEGIPYDKGMR
ncbi:MAG: ABC transporter permease [Clostridia bacterium]|nr:ABC transporter permease [Clostridia bacterium]